METSKLENAKRPSLLVEVGRFPGRLKEVIGSSSVRGFASKCGLSDAVLRSYLRGDTFPTLDRLESIAITADVRTGWLATGEGPKEKNKKPLVAEDQGKYLLNHDEFALVPRYNVQASMGGGADVHSEQVVDHLAFKRSWLKDMDLQSDRLALITAMGDSMYPTIKDGCLMLVDTRKNQQIREGIYVLRMDGALLAKRLQRFLDGAILVKSDNPIYQEIKAEKDQLQLLDIIGRVVWSGGKI